MVSEKSEGLGTVGKWAAGKGLLKKITIMVITWNK